MEKTRKSKAELPGRAADDVFRHFAGLIRSGQLHEGDPLPPEREIVETWGVSRTVVREAVLALSNKGLIDARPRFRPVVRKPGFDAAFETLNEVVTGLLGQSGGIRNLFDIRIMTEASLVRQAALDATRENLAALRDALDANGEVIDDNARFFETDIAFHGVLYDIPCNPVLPAIHRAYSNWLAPQWERMPRSPQRNRINFEAHSAIFNGILMRDPDDAERALRKHLADAWGQVRMTFGEA